MDKTQYITPLNEKFLPCQSLNLICSHKPTKANSVHPISWIGFPSTLKKIELSLCIIYASPSFSVEFMSPAIFEGVKKPSKSPNL